MTPPLALIDVCKQVGPQLDGIVMHHEKPVHGATLLYAITGNESSFGTRAEFVRAEPAYMRGGMYFERAAHLRQQWFRWGVLAASSFGAFQLLYITAYELGFRGHPIDLQQHDISARWVNTLITERFVRTRGVQTLRDLLDAYNSGRHTDAHVPERYIAEGIKHYETGGLV